MQSEECSYIVVSLYCSCDLYLYLSLILKYEHKVSSVLPNRHTALLALLFSEDDTYTVYTTENDGMP